MNIAITAKAQDLADPRRPLLRARPMQRHMRCYRCVWILFVALLLPRAGVAQFALEFEPGIPVLRNGDTLSLAWSGGLSHPQISSIDLDGDMDEDLFFFDRAGNVVVTLLNNGTAGGVNAYDITRAYEHVYPFQDLSDWNLCRDYDGDGRKDLFGSAAQGMWVFRNVSVGGNLEFVLVDPAVTSNYVPTEGTINVTQVDLPGIEDIDGDGDLDLLTFSVFGSYVDYHKNLSQELYGHSDSLEYEVHNRCWGFFREDVNNNTIYLNEPCPFNVPDPQLGFEGQRHHGTGVAPSPDPNDRMHVGSTLLPIDLDGDADKDLLLGDVVSPNLVATFNGGDQDSAFMTSVDSFFPVYDTPVNLTIFPAGFYVDVTNDGVRDLLVTPNYASFSENARSVHFYRNMGTDAVPMLHFEQDDLFQRDMIDHGEGAYPIPFDHNGDGLMDLLVANYGYYMQGGPYKSQVAVWENIGTIAAPAFNLVEDDYMDLSTLGLQSGLHPTFGDVDGDGDKDMYIGDFEGRLHSFENTATGPVAQFSLTQNWIVDDSSSVIDVGLFAAPQFFDLDGDGLLDLLVGERNGNISHYRNQGTTNVPVWHLENDSIGGVAVVQTGNVTGFSVPFMFLNHDAERELLVGSESGRIFHYTGIEGNIGGPWTLADTAWQHIDEGAKTAIALYDWDNDGFQDAVIGNYRGGLSYWRNNVAAAVQDGPANFSDNVFSLVPNPAGTGYTMLVLHIPWRSGMQFQLLNELGAEVRGASINPGTNKLETKDLKPGLYLVRLNDGVEAWSRRLVISE